MKELQRKRKINRIFEAVERGGGGIAFHTMKTLNGKDISFLQNLDNPDIMDVCIERFEPYFCEDIELDNVNDEVLDEVIEILKESNYGITY